MRRAASLALAAAAGTSAAVVMLACYTGPSIGGNEVAHDAGMAEAAPPRVAPRILATGVSPGALAIDETNAYWVDPTDRNVWKASLAGSQVSVLASGQDRLSGIAVDATSVYWSANGSLMKLAIGGGTPVRLATVAATDVRADVSTVDIAVDATHVYWGTFELMTGDVVVSSGAIMKVPLAGGAPTTLATTGGGVAAIAVDARNVYAKTDGRVLAVPLGGGPPVTLLDSSVRSGGVAVNPLAVYTQSDVAVVAIPFDGTPPRALASGQGYMYRLAADGTGVFWTSEDGRGGTRVTVSRDGSTNVLADFPDPATSMEGLAIGRAQIACSSTSARTIWVLAKP